MTVFTGRFIIRREPCLVEQDAAEINAFAGKRIVGGDIDPVAEIGRVNEVIGFFPPEAAGSVGNAGEGGDGDDSQEKYE